MSDIDIKTKVATLAEKSCKSDKPDDAMKYAQAALNLAHAFATIEGAKR